MWRGQQASSKIAAACTNQKRRFQNESHLGTVLASRIVRNSAEVWAFAMYCNAEYNSRPGCPEGWENLHIDLSDAMWPCCQVTPGWWLEMPTVYCWAASRQAVSGVTRFGVWREPRGGGDRRGRERRGRKEDALGWASHKSMTERAGRLKLRAAQTEHGTL